MVKQIILPLVAVIIFIAAIGLYLNKYSGVSFSGSVSKTSENSAKKTLMIGDIIIPVEIANTLELRSKGLSGRASLDQNSGMLFIFESQDVVPNFWMKDMIIPIDIIWINDSKVVRIDQNIQPPAKGTADSKLQIYNPGQPVDFILEVNAGYSAANGIEAGDSVNLSKI